MYKPHSTHRNIGTLHGCTRCSDASSDCFTRIAFEVCVPFSLLFDFTTELGYSTIYFGFFESPIL